MTVEIEEALNLEKVIFVDVRTESEYEEDHILNAINMPLFMNDEHKDVGTIYKMLGKHEAIQKGFDYVSYKLKDMYLELSKLANEYDNMVVYCARGGMRSGSITNVISSLGVNVYQLEGGYKSYRNFVLDYFKTAMEKKKLVSVHGLTGVGKTDLLHMLEEKNVDVLDLEGIAKNSGSIFGFITFDEKSPSQKLFETEIFEKLYFSKKDFIFVESESKRVGHSSVPNEIYESMIGDCQHIILEVSLKNRVDRLCRDYIYSKNEDNIDDLKECINKFRKRLSNKVVDEYIELLETKKYEEVVERYLLEYYDPLYTHSIEKYEYDEVINFDDESKALDKVLDYYNRLIVKDS
ncbi:tRNA 2-selenouridine(34) synthase MnmH [Metaclostridioides mangenotii]|uniref:tRNA 2-selenouridine(34) synthase MnmH n=1 Tax=Metaclostridioides mangenotii TaxID=1540 RepID=UPI000489CA0E|nr:tRNA 2-selenouridine(34) synthase MnmH [Clostridioides mangenotii]